MKPKIPTVLVQFCIFKVKLIFPEKSVFIFPTKSLVFEVTLAVNIESIVRHSAGEKEMDKHTKQHKETKKTKTTKWLENSALGQL